jgi:hypothetical protein
MQSGRDLRHLRIVNTSLRCTARAVQQEEPKPELMRLTDADSGKG